MALQVTRPDTIVYLLFPACRPPQYRSGCYPASLHHQPADVNLLAVALALIMAASRTLLCALLAAACLSAAMASTETSMARKLASARQLNGFRPIPIDASVILLFLSDVEGGDNSPCVAMVNRAMEFKGRSINFFVTAYYADDNGDSRADRLGWKKSVGDKSFREMNMDYVNQYKAGLTVSSRTYETLYCIGYLMGMWLAQCSSAWWPGAWVV